MCNIVLAHWGYETIHLKKTKKKYMSQQLQSPTGQEKNVNVRDLSKIVDICNLETIRGKTNCAAHFFPQDFGALKAPAFSL